MRIRFLLFVALVLCGVSLAVTSAQAQSANNAGYSATVPVSDTSDAQRNHAFAVALGRILTHTAGQGITGAPGYTDALGNAANLVQDYQYQRAAAGASQPFLLRIDFDSSAVQQLASSLQKQIASAASVPGTPAPAVLTATIWVTPMHSALALARLLATVRADSNVSLAEPIGAKGNGVLLRIRTQETLSGLLASLQGSNHLQTVSGNNHPGADASMRWTP